MIRFARKPVSYARGRRGSTTALVSVTVMLAVPVGADAATTFGSALDAEPDPVPVSCDTDGCTAISTVAAPVDGVIVRWSLRSATAGRVGLRIARGVGPFVRGVSDDKRVDVTAGVTTHSTRTPVQIGERLAIVGDDLPAAFAAPGTGITPVVEEHGRWTAGEWRDADADVNGELLVQAVIEPDADRDGWGDETQDLCPGSPMTTTACGPFALEASAPALLPPGGGRVVHTVIVRNNGRGVVDRLPVQLSRAGAVSRTLGDGVVSGCDWVEPRRVCEIDRLAVGESRSIAIAYPAVDRGVTTRVLVAWPGAYDPKLFGPLPRLNVTSRVVGLHRLRISVVPQRPAMPAGRASANLSCPAIDVGPCRVRLDLRTVRTPKGARRPRVLLRGMIVMAPGETTSFRLRLPREVMRFLRGHSSMPLKLSATRSFGTAGDVTGRARLVLRTPRR